MESLRLQDVEYVWCEEGKGDGEGKENAAAEAEAVSSYISSHDVTSSTYDPSAVVNLPFSPASSASLSPPAYLFLVDLSGEYNYVELVKASLLAALEALAPQVWVGLAVYSHKLGLFDLRCTVPTVHYVGIRSSAQARKIGVDIGEEPTTLPLHAVMSLDSFLQQLQLCKENLCAAIESLASHRQQLPEQQVREKERDIEEPDFEAGRGNTSPPPPRSSPSSSPPLPPSPPIHPCGYGAAMSSLLSFLGQVEEQGLETNVRILSFLSQRPNWGVGALADRIAGIDARTKEKVELNQDDWDRFLYEGNAQEMMASGEANDGERIRGTNGAEFYKNIGIAASHRGICIDLYVLLSTPPPLHPFVDLATLRSLPVLTGGALVLYPTLSDCSLPQDLFRQLRLLQGFRCLLRLRSSPEMIPVNVYGHLAADKEAENLFRVGGCDARKVYAVDWEFQGEEGFDSGYGQRRTHTTRLFVFSSHIVRSLTLFLSLFCFVNYPLSPTLQSM